MEAEKSQQMFDPSCFVRHLAIEKIWNFHSLVFQTWFSETHFFCFLNRLIFDLGIIYVHNQECKNRRRPFLHTVFTVEMKDESSDLELKSWSILCPYAPAEKLFSLVVY